MKADLTRDSFRPEQHFTRVVFPQGHALTDAEINEQAQIQVHRDRINTLDVIGKTGTPNGDGFQVVVGPDGKDLLIRPGRYYVDGHLVEGDGSAVPVTSAGSLITLPSLTLDGRPLLVGEWLEVAAPGAATHRFQITAIDAANRRVTVGAHDVGPAPDTSPLGVAGATARRIASYVVQPHWPRPTGTTWSPPLPVLSAAPALYGAYLEVFAQHVDGISDPAQREVALGGIDGASRERMIWQVRLRTLGAVGTPATCADVLPTPVAGGTLRARAKRPTTGTNPCIIEPAAQYRRLENQLYRVEIHQGGTLGVDGGITFKWSRENGSVVMPWLASTASTLTLATVGRDSKLGLASGDWIELLDDQHELSRTPGTLVQIDAVEGTVVKLRPGTATGTTAIADFPFRPRVRRWDHAGAPALAVERPATNDGYLALEDGVEVRFADGAYATGDHWLVPARTTTGDVEWPRDLDGLPIDRPSHGGAPARAALAVVEWDGTAMKVLTDCREQFPSLTHICAKDVCVETDPCERGWTNVQEALEELCQERDLEFHNQHLHGWGVVCGLQVQCPSISFEPENGGDPREWVFLRDGYAIHPTGADIRVHGNAGHTPVDLAQLAIDDGVVVRGDDGKIPDVSVSLWIDKGGGSVADRLHVEAYDPKHKRGWTELLEGTILVDIYEDCIVKIIDFLKEQLSTDPDAPVDLRAKRLTALLNLFWQLFNQTHGKHIYLSGDPQDPSSLDHEDGLLREFFEALKGLLQSKSFCAMFDDIQFPDYDVYRAGLPEDAPRPTTIFGTGRHKRIRVDPRRPVACTCDGGNRINVYDLTAGKLLASTPFPSSSAEVQDVAFGNDSEIYAIAWVGETKVDSVFAVGKIQGDGTITWTADQVQCSLKLVSLVVDVSSPAKVFASARGTGIFVFDLTVPLFPEPLVKCYASGHLVATSHKEITVLYAGVHGTDDNSAGFTSVLGVLANEPNAQKTFALPNGVYIAYDDLALAIGGEETHELYAIGEDDEQSKHLVVWDALSADGELLRVVPIGNGGTSRIAYSPRGNWSMITYENEYRGIPYQPGSDQLEDESQFHPLQIGPVSIATDGEGQRFYVLNWVSDTITVVPALANGEQPWTTAIDVSALEEYRWQAIVVFIKAIGRFVQFLKDCVCEHLLVDCPDPGDKKVYLADISFKDGKVYQICNFHHRRYVHTFPTVEYWMSMVPVIPMLKLAVEKVCCSVLGGFFDRFTPPRDREKTKRDRVNVTKVRHGVSYAKEANLASMFRTTKTRLGFATLLGRAAVERKLSQPAPGATPTKTLGFDVIRQPEGEAVYAKTSEMGVNVTKVRTVDNGVMTTLKSFIAPTKLRKGDDVELLVDHRGKVVGYERAPSVTTEEANVSEELENPDSFEQRGEPASSGKQARAKAARAKAARDKGEAEELIVLRRKLEAMTKSHVQQAATIEELQSRMERMEALLAKRAE